MATDLTFLTCDADTRRPTHACALHAWKPLDRRDDEDTRLEVCFQCIPLLQCWASPVISAYRIWICRASRENLQPTFNNVRKAVEILRDRDGSVDACTREPQARWRPWGRSNLAVMS